VIYIAGIAYILRLLNQWDAFDSLHWFQSVREKYAKERNNVERQRAEATKGSDQKLQQTLALTLKRIETYQKVL
jgi:WASH complex subunit 7